VRTEVVRALAEIGGEQATMTLGQAVFGDTDPEVRLAAVDALEKLAGLQARVFVEAATKDFDPRVAGAAREALSRMPP
jgi:HEAT repeat protein